MLRRPNLLGLLPSQKALTACFVTLLMAGRLGADDGVTNQFGNLAEGPLTISVFQELPGFIPKLHALNSVSDVFDFSQEWVAMADADIWVFFLKNRADASFLPNFVFELLDSEYDGSPNFVLTADIRVDGAGKSRFMSFFFIEDFEDRELEELGCEVAALLYFQLDGYAWTDVTEEQKSCGN